MKITLIETEYITATLEGDFLEYKSYANDNMTQEDLLEIFKNFTDILLNLSKEGKIKENYLRVLIDTSEENFLMLPETQEYLDKHYFSKFVHLSKKLALLPSEDFFNSVSVGLLMDEENAQSLGTKYFKSKEEAMVWLNS